MIIYLFKLEMTIIGINQALLLIELMIAIILGLLITAAAVQLYITGREVWLFSKGVANLQKNKFWF
jgi:type IV pilus assembly protein PilW